MIYRVKPSVLKVVIEHAVSYGLVASYSYEEPYFRVETDGPFPEVELDLLDFEVWQ